MVIYPLIDTGGHGSAGLGATLLAAGAVLLCGFVFQQRRAARRNRPTSIELSLFSGRAFPAALLTSVAFFAVMNGLMLVVVVQLQIGLNASPLTAGLTLLPSSAGLGLASWIAGTHLVPRFGAKLMFVGLSVELMGMAGSVIAYATSSAGRYPIALLPALAVCGIGIGLFSPTFFTTALQRVAPHEIGSAAGLLNAVQQFGASVGVALLGTILFTATNPTAGARAAFLTAAGIVVLAASAVVVMTRTSDRT